MTAGGKHDHEPTAEEVALLPVVFSEYRWELAKNKFGKTRVGLWHGPRHMGWLKWAWRVKAWQAKQLSPLYPGCHRHPGYAASCGARIVMHRGSLLDCAWALLAACQNGWHDNLENAGGRLDEFRRLVASANEIHEELDRIGRELDGNNES